MATQLFPTPAPAPASAPVLPPPAINISSPPPATCHPSSDPHSTPRNSIPLSSSMLHSSSSSATPHSSISTVVPQYPYNVSMPPFAGALLPYERAPMPDDNDVQTRLPSICVDYLSHNWDESDVWTSWKAMTRHKHEMANGVRLENASWRTWAKQRSNLKTISPETLNWLKDSDVTWLYGPLHTAVDPVPPPKMSSLQDRFNLDSQAPSPNSLPGSSALASCLGSSASSARSTKVPGKPILKHRSLSEILGVPTHPPSIGGDSGSDPATDQEGDGSQFEPTKPARVTIAHPASDSTLVNMRHHDPSGRGSPPVLGVGYDSSTSGEESDLNHSAPGRDLAPNQQATPRKTAFRTSGYSSGSGTEDHVKPKKHISFSHRVEQCIAVDSEEERGLYASKGLLRPKPGLRPPAEVIEDDEDDDEEDVLTFRSSASRHPGINVAAHRYGSHSSHLSPTLDQQIMQSSSSSSMTSAASSLCEPHTIARMAPTTLKSSEVLPAPSPVVVYDRDPIWTGASSPQNLGRPNFPTYTVTSSPTGSGLSPNSKAPASPLPASSTSIPSGRSTPSYYSRTYGPVVSTGGTTFPIPSPARDENSTFSSHHYTTSAPPTTQWVAAAPDDDDTEEFTAMGFDYFSGPDPGLGDEYDMSRLPSQHLVGPTSNGYAPGGINEDPIDPRSIVKNQSSPPGTIRHQGPILVPQLKSPGHKPSSSSSTSSLPASPLSHPDAPTSTSSSTPTPSPHAEKFPHIAPAASSDRPDRLARGRSSSRGSSASSFERAPADHYRRSSHSPSSSQSPPVTGGGSSQIRRSAGSASSLSRNNGERNSNKSRVIDVTIGEEAEEEEGTGSRAEESRSSGSPPGSKLISAPRPASTQLFEEDLDLKDLLMKKSGSVVSLEWADETERGGSSPGGGGVNKKRLSNDEFGFGNYYNPSGSVSGTGGGQALEDENGVIGKAVETARELVSAIWSVGTRSVWGFGGSGNHGGQNGEG